MSTTTQQLIGQRSLSAMGIDLSINNAIVVVPRAGDLI